MENLKSSKLGKALWKVHIPRWIVFLLDQSVVLFSYVLLIVLYRYILHRPIDTGVDLRMLMAIGTFSVLDLLMGIYKGAIRYSEIREMVRIFFYVFLSCCMLFSFTLILDNYMTVNPLSISWTCVYGMITFTLLFMMRIGIKYTYYYLGSFKKQKRRVVVFGCDSRSVMMVNMMKADVKSEYKPVAFIDFESKDAGKMMMGVKVYALDKISDISSFFHEQRADALIISDSNRDELKETLLDQLLESEIQVLLADHPHDMDKAKSQNKLSIHNIQIEDLLNREVINTENPEVRVNHTGKVVMVTGAAGSIGSEIVMQVGAANPACLIIVDQAESPLHEIQLRLQAAYPELNLEVFICDIRNRERLRTIFEKQSPEVVYHAAAYKHVPMMEKHPCEAVTTNVMGTKHVVDLTVEFSAERFVMVSTDKAVNPTNVMGCSKRIAEIYVQSLSLALKKRNSRTRIITTRFGNVLGSNGSVVPLFKRQIDKGGPVTVTHKDIIRYFMTIPEACRLVLEAGCMGQGGEIFVFDMGAPVKIYDMAKRMIRLAGLTPGKDIEIIETGLRPGEKLYEELLSDQEKTMQTHHKKIMIAKVREYDYLNVERALEVMITHALDCDKTNTVRCMKMLVPEFKSRNSVYEELDEELEKQCLVV
ncbi:MAG: polysaccharide biosynthesis protein [Bacteroidales bacterium]